MLGTNTVLCDGSCSITVSFFVLGLISSICTLPISRKKFWRSSHWQKACLSLDLKTPWTGNLQSTASCWVFKAGPQFKFLRKQGQGLMELTFHYILVLSTWNAGWRQRTWRASWDKRTNHVSVSLKHRFSVWTREFSNKKRTHHIQANIG